MSGLLQRLVNQALGDTGAPRIRSAMCVHAQVPLNIAADTPAVRSTLGDVPSMPATTPPAVQSILGNDPPVAGLHARSPAAVTHHDASIASRAGRPGRAPDSTAAELPLQLAPQSANATHALPRPLLEAVTRIEEVVLPIAPVPPRAQTVEFRQGESETSEPTEVHVHIGRIEITALSESQVSTQSRPPARQTRPLAEYLARRGNS